MVTGSGWDTVLHTLQEPTLLNKTVQTRTPQGLRPLQLAQCHASAGWVEASAGWPTLGHRQHRRGSLAVLIGCCTDIFNTTSGWVQAGADIDGEAAFDLSGGSVSLSADGQTVAIGAYLNDAAGSSAGHVRVYSLE
jgi:hypothetical protein